MLPRQVWGWRSSCVGTSDSALTAAGSSWRRLVSTRLSGYFCQSLISNAGSGGVCSQQVRVVSFCFLRVRDVVYRFSSPGGLVELGSSWRRSHCRASDYPAELCSRPPLRTAYPWPSQLEMSAYLAVTYSMRRWSYVRCSFTSE